MEAFTRRRNYLTYSSLSLCSLGELIATIFRLSLSSTDTTGSLGARYPSCRRIFLGQQLKVKASQSELLTNLLHIVFLQPYSLHET